MFTCIHDPGFALFLAETRSEDAAPTGPIEWAAFAGTLLLAALSLIVTA